MLDFPALALSAGTLVFYWVGVTTWEYIARGFLTSFLMCVLVCMYTYVHGFHVLRPVTLLLKSPDQASNLHLPINRLMPRNTHTKAKAKSLAAVKMVTVEHWSDWAL